MASTISIIVTASTAAAQAAIRALARTVNDLGRRALASAPGMALLAGKITLIISAGALATGALGNLLGAVTLLAPALASAGLVAGGLHLAFRGMGDALQAGLDGDTEKFAQALKKLAPQAADVVKTLVNLRDQWKGTAKDFQGRVFEGAAGELASLSKFIKPIADEWLPRLANKFAEVRNAIADGIARYAADGRLEAVWRNVHIAVSALLDTIPHLGRAFGDILEVAAPRFAELGGSIESAAKRFSDWIRQMKEDGTLQEWVRKAMEGWGQLKEIAGNVGEFLGAIFRTTSDDGQTFLEKLNRITQKMADWANSDDGQKIIDTFAKIITWILACEPALNFIVGRVEWMATQFQWLGMVVKGVWEGIVGIVGWAINWILTGYEKVMRAAAAAADAMGMDSLAGKLRGAANAVAGFRDDVNNYLNGIRKTVDITVNYRARMIGNHLVSGSQQSGTYSSGIGGRASGGIVGAASGGARSRLTMVGERGWELVDFAQGRVFNHEQSKEMVRRASSSEGGPTVNIYVQGSIRSDRDLIQLIRNEFQNGGFRGVVRTA